MWSESVGQNSWGPGSGIKPLSREDALAVLEEQEETDLIEKYFGEMPKAGGEDDERDGFPLRLPKPLKERAQELAASEGLSLNAYIIEAVRQKASGGVR
jgi:predicted HicB family RNase H-like nuclease